jgi:competence protein ComEC
MVVQDQGEIGLINAGTEKDAEFSVLPFLRTQGINRIHWAIATHSHLNPGQDPGWQRMISSLPMPTVIHPSLNAPILLNGLSIIAVNIPPAVVQLQVGAQRWLLLNCRADQCQSQSMSPGIPAADVLWWSGAPLSSQLLNATRPTVAIATSRDLQPETQQHLTQRHIKTYLVGQDGAVQWSERQGYVAKLVSTDPSTQPF